MGGTVIVGCYGEVPASEFKRLASPALSVRKRVIRRLGRSSLHDMVFACSDRRRGQTWAGGFLQSFARARHRSANRTFLGNGPRSPARRTLPLHEPARFSLVHGGKDRQPFAVPIKVRDQTIAVLRSAVDRAKLGRDDRLGAIARLDDESRRLERSATGPTLLEYVAEERRRSAEYGGRSVFG